MKIITVTLNPSLDKTLYFDDHFVAGALNRAKQTVLHAGGKGINVARMYRLLGIRATAFGFMGGDGGNILARKMLEENIQCHFVKTEAPTRYCYKMIDQFGSCTEANEAGGPIAEEELRRMISSIDRCILQVEEEQKEEQGHEKSEKKQMTYLFLCGSIPPGIKKGIYAAMVKKYSREDIRVIVDAQGEGIKLALDERPWLIKPNREELEELVGRPVHTVQEAAQMSRVIQNAYHTNVLCTLGEMGAVYTDHICSVHVTAPKVEMKGFTGAGDTFLSCFVYAFDKSQGDVSTALRFAAAAAAAKIEMVGTALPGKDRITKYLAMPQIKQIAGSVNLSGMNVASDGQPLKD